jgi:hypothetical protein
MFDTERKAGLIDALPVEGLKAPRTLMAFRRRQGILPTPATRLLDELRNLAGSLQSLVRIPIRQEEQFSSPFPGGNPGMALAPAISA